MSWFCEELFLNKEAILSQGDTDAEDFIDLITVIAALEALTDLGKITPRQKERFDLFLKDPSQNYKILHLVCKKIANYLQDKYTDEGYLEFMKDKYKLNDEQIDTLRIFMKSHLSHKVLTKPFNKYAAPYKGK